MSSAHALTRQTCLVLPEYCLFSKVVLQYQYQGSSIVLQYKTERLVHPWSVCACQGWGQRGTHHSLVQSCAQTESIVTVLHTLLLGTMCTQDTLDRRTEDMKSRAGINIGGYKGGVQSQRNIQT